ncbi:MAG: M15 family metallopeptidase [Clostridiales bacterium]|jgi:D-alanyl-D-alanine carboxypeptidase|nr:M15 family metallopeptidase [Clostridiales bacterium]
MEKAKIPIILSACILIILLLTGYLFFRKDSPDNEIPIHTDRGTAAASTVSPGAISINSGGSGNYTYIPPTYEYDDNNKDNEEDSMPNNEPTKAPWTPATEMDLDPKSITVYVNKEYCLPKDYTPENLVVPNITFDITGNSERKFMRVEAAVAIEKLFSSALEDGITLYGISGYRSYSRQKDIFLNNIVHKGKKHTLKYSAVPGTSEHQTGLAMDVSSKSVRYKLITSFATCKEGIWLADNAHKFGFIIRYPKDHYDSTGYAYEPWHIRYVGEDLANYLYSNNMTLDDYYKYEPSEGFDFEKIYASLINYKPPVTPTPIPEEELEEQDSTDELADEELEDDELEDEDKEDENLEDEDSENEDTKDEGPANDDLENENSENPDLENEDSGNENSKDEDIKDDVPEDIDKNNDINDNEGVNTEDTGNIPPPDQNTPPPLNPDTGQT